MQYNELDKLGVIIKSARKANGYTREQLAERLHITPRYLMSIENENKKPSFDVLFRLIRDLGISADTIFYPESKTDNPNIEHLVRLVYQCDLRETEIVLATVKALLNKN